MPYGVYVYLPQQPGIVGSETPEAASPPVFSNSIKLHLCVMSGTKGAKDGFLKIYGTSTLCSCTISTAVVITDPLKNNMDCTTPGLAHPPLTSITGHFEWSNHHIKKPRYLCPLTFQPVGVKWGSN